MILGESEYYIAYDPVRYYSTFLKKRKEEIFFINRMGERGTDKKLKDRLLEWMNGWKEIIPITFFFVSLNSK